MVCANIRWAVASSEIISINATLVMNGTTPILPFHHTLRKQFGQRARQHFDGGIQSFPLRLKAVYLKLSL